MATEPTRIPQTQKMELWLADLVCPVEGAPIRRGALLTASGRVLAVGDEAFVRPSIPVAEERDFGRAILIPGLVNAHTHLELSGIERESGPMEEWIVSLVREVRGWPAHLFLASARIGVAASLAAGVTCVGDVSISGESATAIAGGGMRGVVFHEVLGLDPARADDILAQKLKDQALFPEYKGAIPDAVRHGLSPHAPYSASLGLYRAVRDEARARGWPVATHLGESAGEVEFLQEGGGALARAHRELNGSLDGFKPSGLRPVAHLDWRARSMASHSPFTRTRRTPRSGGSSGRTGCAFVSVRARRVFSGIPSPMRRACARRAWICAWGRTAWRVVPRSRFWMRPARYARWMRR